MMLLKAVMIFILIRMSFITLLITLKLNYLSILDIFLEINEINFFYV